MRECTNCKKHLEEGAKFCDNCGTKVVELISCSNCGEKTNVEAEFCSSCGTSLIEETTDQTVEEAAAASTTESTEKKKNFFKKFSKKSILFSSLGALVIVAIIAFSSFSSVTGTEINYGLYLKDGEIFYNDYTDKGAREITTRLINDSSVSNRELAYAKGNLSVLIAFSEDGKRIFYPDRINDSDDGFTLYYRNINKPEEEPVKIDSDIILYSVNSAGDQVLYTKGNDQILYVHDLKDKQKISSNVTNYYFTNDFKKIGYLTGDSNYYNWYANKESVKLASDISYVEYVSHDLTTIYYMKDGSLYKQVEGSNDKEKIASDIESVVNIYNTGEVYYAKSEEIEVNLLDYIEDDMLQMDATIVEPENPDYPEYPDYPASPENPYWYDYDTDEEYEAAMKQYEKDYEEYDKISAELYAAYEKEYDKVEQAYDEAYDLYRDKLLRDELREDLQNETVEITKNKLYYYDGKEEILVTDALVDDMFINYADAKPIITLEIYNQSKSNKVKLSEITSYYAVTDYVYELFQSSADLYVAVGATTSIIDETDASAFRLSSDGSVIYFLDDVSTNEDGDLYKIILADGKVGKPEKFDTDVNVQSIYFVKDNQLAYYKNVNDSSAKGDLFINKEPIDTDVSFYGIFIFDNQVLYFTDYNLDKNQGTLKMYENKKKTKIADDVYEFNITDKGDIVYLYDYSTKNFTGSLYLYNNGKPKKVDDDVIGLLPISDFNIRGVDYYGW